MKELNSMKFRELKELEKQIKYLKEQHKELRVYKVTFHVGFMASKHDDSDLGDPEVFGEYFANRPSNLIVKDFNLKGIEDVSGSDVVELEPKDFPEMFQQ
jgi:hypothetical protein